MRLPFLWMAAALACGIALARAGASEAPERAGAVVWVCLVVAAAALLAGLALLRAARLQAAWLAGVLAWAAVGGLAGALESQAMPAEHVTRLVAAGQVPDDVALRWQGRLRGDPLRLPWGTRYEIELEAVEIAGRARAASGGLRISHFRMAQEAEYASARAGQPPSQSAVLRAGDRVQALVRARPPRNFLNPGAFDARAHLAREEVHLTASLRSGELLRRLDDAPPSLRHRLARLRGALLERLDALFAAQPERAAVLRGMLLGDRSFVDHDTSEQFRRTSVYHVLVVSGMHVAALALAVFWLGRRLRLPRWVVVVLTLAVLAAFVAVVEDKPPIVRAALTAAIVMLGMLLFRRVELLNTIAMAAWLLLLRQPDALADPSFQLSFLAAAMIGALGLPWMDRTSAPYRHALHHLTDVTRDPAHAPRVAQFRLDVRDAAAWLAARLPLAPERAGRITRAALAGSAAIAFRLWEVFLVSAAIQLGMQPVMAAYFHQTSVAGLAANIPASFLSAAIVPLGFLSLALGAVWESAGALGGALVGGLAAMLLATVEWFSRAGWSAWRVPGPPLWLLAAHGAMLALLAASLRARRRTAVWASALALAVTAALVATHPFPAALAGGKLEITTLDVGQGDAIFAAFPDGRTLLLDGGGLFGTPRMGGFRAGLDIGEQVVSPYLWSRGVRRLDALALSHAHQDHLDGLHAVLRNFQVGELWVGRDADSPAYRALLETAARRGVPVVHLARGDQFVWGAVRGTLLWPERQQSAPAAPARNNDSLVLRLDYGGTSALLAGDIERDVERELAARGWMLDVDFLKVPHHGSRTSATREFLQAVTPQAAAISLSATNPFGHPHPEVLARLAAGGARVLRTDRDGAVTFLSDGMTWSVRGFAAPPE